MALLYFENFDGLTGNESTITEYIEGQYEAYSFLSISPSSTQSITLAATTDRYGVANNALINTGSSAACVVGFNIHPSVSSPSTTVHICFDFKSVGPETSPRGIFSVQQSRNYSSGAPNAPSGGNTSVNVFFLYYDSVSDNYRLVNNSDVVIAESVNNFSDPTIWRHFEVEYNQTAGTVKVWIDDVLEIDYSGGLPAQTIRNIVFGESDSALGMIAIWDDTGPGAFNAYVGDFKPVRLLPNGAGSQTDSTPTGAVTAYEAVDDSFPDGSTTYTVLASDGDRDLYTYEDIPVADQGNSILAVIAQPCGFKEGVGGAIPEAIAKQGGSESVISGIISLPPTGNGIGHRFLSAVFPTDPNTGLAWTDAGVASAEFGVQLKVPNGT